MFRSLASLVILVGGVAVMALCIFGIVAVVSGDVLSLFIAAGFFLFIWIILHYRNKYRRDHNLPL